MFGVGATNRLWFGGHNLLPGFVVLGGFLHGIPRLDFSFLTTNMNTPLGASVYLGQNYVQHRERNAFENGAHRLLLSFTTVRVQR